MTHGAHTDPYQIAGDLWDGWKGGLAFDVGANIGQSVPELLARFDWVVSLEPAAESWAVLAGVVHPSLVKLNVAASDHDGDVLLWETDGNVEQGQLISPEHFGFRLLDGPKRERPVPCVTLDTLAAEHGVPDLVKIDTEGHELKILQGAAKLLAGAKTGWLIEFHSCYLADGCMHVLEAAGYEPRIIRHPHYATDDINYANHGFIRADVP